MWRTADDEKQKRKILISIADRRGIVSGYATYIRLLIEISVNMPEIEETIVSCWLFESS